MFSDLTRRYQAVDWTPAAACTSELDALDLWTIASLIQSRLYATVRTPKEDLTNGRIERSSRPSA